MRGKLLFVLIAALVALSSTALALPDVLYVKINGDEYVSGDRLVVERGDELDIKVKMEGTENETDIEVEADLLGYEYNDIREISDSTHTFDIDEGDTVYKELSITIPDNADKDLYDLRIRVGGRTGDSFEGLYRISLESARHALNIRDVIFSPENEVVSGRALLGIVRVKNVGEMDEESIKVKISIPALGLSASDYIDEIEEEESVTSEELYIRIPSCIEEGIYTVKAEVEYDEGYMTEERETTIRIVQGETCETIPDESDQDDEPAKTTITVGATVQDVMAGSGGIIYPISIHNSGMQSKAYTLGVDGIEGWATVKLTPSNTVVVGAGETKSVYVYLSANEDAAAGQRMFSVSVRSEATVLEEIPLKANVVAGEGTPEDGVSSISWDSLKRGLEIGLIALIILLVILGLIIGFNKLRGDKDEDEGQTYY